MSKYNYDSVKRIVEEKGCQLNMTEEEFKTEHKNPKSNIRIISSCGHPTTVQCNNIIYTNTGVICKQCHYESYKGNSGDYAVQEYKVIKGLSKFCTDFEFKSCCEGCLADFVIRPKTCAEDLWLPIQMKTTMKVCHGKYVFPIKSQYEDMCILCFAIQDQRVWIVRYTDVQVNKLSIGVNSSIYDKYEVGTNEIATKFSEMYHTFTIYPLQDILNKSPEPLKQEQHFMRYREQLFPRLEYDYPQINNRVYDLIINKRYKVQDKVITAHTRKGRENIDYIVNIERNNYKYCIGDNDFYWFFLPDRRGAYIVPENCLYEKGVISAHNQRIEGSTSMILHPYKKCASQFKYGWMNEHLYFFDSDHDREKVYMFFADLCRPEIPVDEAIPPLEITTKGRFNSIDKKCLKVSRI